jgi:hypothetical protein
MKEGGRDRYAQDTSRRSLLDDGWLIDPVPDWPDERFPHCALCPSRNQRRARDFIDLAPQAVR